MKNTSSVITDLKKVLRGVRQDCRKAEEICARIEQN